MVHAKSPPPPSTSAKSATLQTLQRLFRNLFRRTKGFFHRQALPYVASQTCATLLDANDPTQQRQCRRILRTRLELNPNQLHHFLHTPMGEALLTWCSQFFQVPRDRESPSALQDILLQMTADPEGLSLLSVLRRSPDRLQLNTDQLLLTAKRVQWLLQETQAAIAQIRELALLEAQTDVAIAADQPDLSQPGPFTVESFSFVLERSLGRSEQAAQTTQRPLTVWCYQPQPWPRGRVPVVVQSHGLASSPEDMASYAQHLASHGYFVVAPQHPGSDVEQVRRMLAGQSSDVFQLSEFIDRPRDIRHLLDVLERRNATDFDGKLELQSVGLMGYSFGAYTAFALAGANIQFDQLELACSPAIEQPNISLLLQCQALGLPRQAYSLHDDRVKAILSIDAVGSEIFGAENIAHVQVPVLLMAGSHDAAAPLVFEQLRLFQWLTTPHAYLALMEGKSHLRDAQRLVNVLNLHVNLFPRVNPTSSMPPFESYTNALSLAFLNQHLAPDRGSVPLQANYGAYLSQPPFHLWVISQASRAALQQTLQSLDGSIPGRHTHVSS